MKYKRLNAYKFDGWAGPIEITPRKGNRDFLSREVSPIRNRNLLNTQALSQLRAPGSCYLSHNLKMKNHQINWLYSHVTHALCSAPFINFNFQTHQCISLTLLNRLNKFLLIFNCTVIINTICKLIYTEVWFLAFQLLWQRKVKQKNIRTDIK